MPVIGEAILAEEASAAVGIAVAAAATGLAAAVAVGLAEFAVGRAVAVAAIVSAAQTTEFAGFEAVSTAHAAGAISVVQPEAPQSAAAFLEQRLRQR
mmetsp:Transcript_24956/g.41378  ORF Transcript_24956/g.41378 Transcript_24956/m.41378 type:complete len:97 (-) Transcript_24956:2136-2426(-)